MPTTPMTTQTSPEADSRTLLALGRLESVRASWRSGDLGLTTLDDYYNNEQPLSYMSADLQRDMGESVTQLAIAWPQMVADAHAERHVCTGFTYPSTDGLAPTVTADTLWQWWQANDMDERSNMAQLDAIALSKAALIVGPSMPGDDVPTMTAESALDVAWVRDPRSGIVVRGMKAWEDVDDDGTVMQWRNVYVPGRRITLRADRGRWLVDSDVESSPMVPLVPLVNRPRLKGAAADGRSEFAPIIPLANAANKMATDMMVSGEFHAMPRRWVFGMKASDFRDANGNAKNVWSVIKGRLWATENKPSDVSVGQFPESSLTNFHETIKLLARLTAQLSGLPSDYMSFESVNPPSADALRAAERRMVKRCEDQQIAFSGSYEVAMRHAIYFATRRYDPTARLLAADWRDPGTPTKAQVTDATVKAVTTRGADGRPLVPTEQGRIDLGYTPQQRQTMMDMEQAASESNPETRAAMAILNGTSGGAG